MTLSPRFALDILFMVGGAFLVAAAFAFTTPVAGWIAFGVLAGLTVLAGASAITGRSYSRKLGHGLIAAVALWSMIATLIFSGPLLMWFVIGDAIAVGALGIADLTVHEVTTESVVHRLEVTTAPAEMTGRTAG